MSIKLKISIYFISIFLLVGAVSVYSFFTSSKIKKYLADSLPSAIYEVQRTSKLDTIAQLIRYDDEVLTQSARNYAFTGDQKWQDRYFEFVPKLEMRIGEALELGDMEDKVIFTGIKDANLALVDLETKAMDYVQKKDLDNARKILDGEEYKKQKAIYKDGIDQYLARRGANFDSATIVSVAKLDEAKLSLAKLVRNQLIFTAFFVILFFLILAFLFFVIIKMFMFPLGIFKETAKEILKGDLNAKVDIKNKDEIGDFAKDFNQMTAYLRDSIENVNIKVREQTQEIQEKATMVENQSSALVNVLEDIEQERDKIEIILESIGDAVFVVDSDKNIILANKITEKISGFSKEEMIDKHYGETLQFIFEANEEVNDKFVNDAIATGEIQEMSNHTLLIRKNGEKISVSDSASPIKDKDGNILGCVVVFRDVTNERQIDKAKTEFVSLAAHQLKTPIGAVSWDLEMLLSGDYGELSEKQKEVVQEVYGLNKRMTDLVTSFLNISRIELGTFMIEPKEIDFVSVCEDVLTELKERIALKKHQIIKNYQNEKIEALADPKILRIIFQNLFSNAVKYTSDNGQVIISIKKEDDKIKISVANNGEPIPKGEQAKIFNKLFRASNAQDMDPDGNGLGLYLLKSIVETGGGKTWFESEEGKDTIFFVEFPLPGMKKKEGEKALS